MSALRARQTDPTPASPSQLISRWWRVASGLLMNMALGTLYAWSVFVAPLEAEFHWTRSETSTAFTVAVTVFARRGFVSRRQWSNLWHWQNL
jgi:OFA family oxalate/formate antiporter-like MFS transporter